MSLNTRRARQLLEAVTPLRGGKPGKLLLNLPRPYVSAGGSKKAFLCLQYVTHPTVGTVPEGRLTIARRGQVGRRVASMIYLSCLNEVSRPHAADLHGLD
ncbi:hypothetical protein ACWDFR_36530 [Streptomyces sp. 900105755]